MPQNNDTDTKAKTGNNTERQAENDKKSKNWQEALKISMSLFIPARVLWNNTERQAENDKKHKDWQEALKVSMSLFIPAFVLMILSFFLFNPALVSLFTGLRAKQVETEVKNLIDEEIKKQLQQEAKNQISQERTKILGEQQALLKLEQESSLGKTYISQEISKQAEEQAKKVAKDEISQAKGDLYGQMTFPVIFAIASIFAAFAVKDIVTKIWDRQEMTKLEEALAQNLENNLVPKAVEKKEKEITNRIQELEGNTNWLEHQILSIFTARMVDEIKSNPKISEDEPYLSLVMGKLHNMSVATLEGASNQFDYKNALPEIQRFEKAVTTALKGTLAKNSSERKDIKGLEKRQEEFYKGESLFLLQMILIRNTLSKLSPDILPEKDRKFFLQEIETIIRKDPRREVEERRKITKGLSSETNPGVQS